MSTGHNTFTFTPIVFFSGIDRAYECVWGTINGDFVSGWGVDFGWCQYAAQVRKQRGELAG